MYLLFIQESNNSLNFYMYIITDSCQSKILCTYIVPADYANNSLDDDIFTEPMAHADITLQNPVVSQ